MTHKLAQAIPYALLYSLRYGVLGQMIFLMLMSALGAMFLYALLTPDPCFYGPGC
jgi:hypothetical protein